MGAERVSVAALEQTFAARNALYESLERRIGAGGRLTEERSSPVKIPVPIGTNPIGLAVVPTR